jgi:MFS family permease
MSLGLVVFGVGSVAGTLATRPGHLIAARALMGIGGALIVPATLSILVNIFTESHERRRAITYWTLMNAAGIFVGPITGALLLRNFWWGSCFLVNVPVVLLALLLSRVLVPTSRDPDRARFDLVGAGVSTAALASLLWAIIEAPDRGWSDPTILLLFVGSLTLGTLFVIWELRVPNPMLDVGAFRNPQLSAAAIAMTIAFIAMTGAMFLSSQSLQLAKGYTPLAAALAISGPIVAVNFLVMPRAPRLVERFGPRVVIATGISFISLAALVIAATTPTSGYANLLIGFATMALAFSVFVPASTEAIVTAVPAEKSGSASALNQVTRQLGTALGVAIGGSIAASGYHASFASQQNALPVGISRVAGGSITGAITVARTLEGKARSVLLSVADRAFLHGVRLALIAAASLAILGALFALVMIPKKSSSVEPPGLAVGEQSPGSARGVSLAEETS